MLDFKKITLEDKGKLMKYLYRYGENSCQHSFVSMFCMAEKYGDMYAEDNGYLFILRSGKCTPEHRIYLFPMGDIENKKALIDAISKILEDAKKYGKKVRFETLTKKATDAINSLFPGRFKSENIRDYAEYIYTHEKLALLPGKELASKRYDINTFFRDYGERCAIERIGQKHMEEIKAFQKEWLSDMLKDSEDVQLELENTAIGIGLDNFFELGLSGIVIYVDGKMTGYAYGAPISDECYNVIIEKGDRSIADIYRILNRDLVRMCCDGFSYINREEDVGVEGLRKAKMSYKPDILLEKYIVTEVQELE